MGRQYRTGLPALPPRGHQALLERVAVRHAQVRRRSSRRRAGHASIPPRQGQRICDPPARKAESQAVLRDFRAAVPQVLRRSQPPAGQHGRRPDVAAGATARQRGHAAGVRGQPPAGAADDHAWTYHGQRPQARHPSYLVRPGDQIQVKNREHSRKLAADNLAAGGGPPVPDWLDRVSTDPPEGRVSRLPAARTSGCR